MMDDGDNVVWSEVYLGVKLDFLEEFVVVVLRVGSNIVVVLFKLSD